MTTRRNFLKAGAASMAGLLAGRDLYATVSSLDDKFGVDAVSKATAVAGQYESKRPAVSARKFVSEAVEKKISSVKAKIKDPKLAWMFENCYPNTLDTTVEFKMKDGRPDTFVLTGDIHAMWLRDS